MRESVGNMNVFMVCLLMVSVSGSIYCILHRVRLGCYHGSCEKLLRDYFKRWSRAFLRFPWNDLAQRWDSQSLNSVIQLVSPASNYVSARSRTLWATCRDWREAFHIALLSSSLLESKWTLGVGSLVHSQYAVYRVHSRAAELCAQSALFRMRPLEECPLSGHLLMKLVERMQRTTELEL